MSLIGDSAPLCFHLSYWSACLLNHLNGRFSLIVCRSMSDYVVLSYYILILINFHFTESINVIFSRILMCAYFFFHPGSRSSHKRDVLPLCSFVNYLLMGLIDEYLMFVVIVNIQLQESL